MVTIVGNHTNTTPTPAPAAADKQGDMQSGVNGSSSSDHDAGALNQNFNQFLTLLTTQLKHQDPTAPMDSTQFTNQLVSFSGVEQQIKMNDKLTSLLNNSKASQTTLGLSYIGLNVNIESNQFDYPGEGEVKMKYTLPKDASLSSVTIVDKTGQPVRTFTDPKLTKGAHTVAWDGKDNNGHTMPAGTYKLMVGAIDSDQKSMTVAATVPGLVTGVSTGDDGNINLMVGAITTQLMPLAGITQASL